MDDDTAEMSFRILRKRDIRVLLASCSTLITLTEPNLSDARDPYVGLWDPTTGLGALPFLADVSGIENQRGRETALWTGALFQMEHVGCDFRASSVGYRCLFHRLCTAVLGLTFIKACVGPR